jgi:hypothetical protein
MSEKKKPLLIGLAVLLLLSAGVMYYIHYNQTAQGESFADERVELLALVFRLAGRREYSRTDTNYQHSLNRTFGGFANHTAVEFARSLGFGFDAVTNFAVHIEKVGDRFVLLENNSFLFSCGRWTSESVETFIELLNQFYIDTDFAAFFQRNTALYTRASSRFIADLYRHIEIDWFSQYGIQSDQIRITLSPSILGGYGPSVYDNEGNLETVYSILQVTNSYRNLVWFLVHELSHSFANPIAEAWYEEDDAFRRMSDNSVDPVKLPYYAQGITMAREYVTRAFTILYRVEIDGADTAPLFREEVAEGFRNIDMVYQMVVSYSGQ